MLAFQTRQCCAQCSIAAVSSSISAMPAIDYYGHIVFAAAFASAAPVHTAAISRFLMDFRLAYRLPPTADGHFAQPHDAADAAAA
jgi:hypothetical protein